MGYGKKTGGKDFQKGQAGGPGRPATPDDLKNVKKLSTNEMQALLAKYLRMSKGQLIALHKDPDVPAIDLLVMSIIQKAVVHGDHQRMNFLLDRTIGRVTDKVEVSLPEPTIIRRRDNSIVELGAVIKDADED